MNNRQTASRRVDPDGLPAATMLAILATAGFFYVSIMPALVSGLVAGLGFSAPAAGRVVACNVYGAVVGALGAALIVRHVAWRRAAAGLLVALLALDLASVPAHDAVTLAVLRAAHGLCGGALVGIAYGVMSRTASPDRCFAVLMVVQSSLGGLGRMFLPRLVPHYGAGVLFVSIAAFSVVALALLPALPAYPRPAVAHAAGRVDAPSPPVGAALGVILCGVFLFQAGNMSVTAYVMELGKAQHFDLRFVTTTVGVANWLAMLGALLVVAIGARLGRTGPILAGLLVAMAGNAAYHWAGSAAVYAAANATTEVAWFFVIPYLLGQCAEFDRSGRSAALAGFVSKLGLATGPLLAAAVLERTARSYDAVVSMAVAAIALSALCALAAGALQRRLYSIDSPTVRGRIT